MQRNKNDLEISQAAVTEVLAQLRVRVDVRHDWAPGDSVEATDGPFRGMRGAVVSVEDDRGRIKVMLDVFGRPTPILLPFEHVRTVNGAG